MMEDKQEPIGGGVASVPDSIDARGVAGLEQQLKAAMKRNEQLSNLCEVLRREKCLCMNMDLDKGDLKKGHMLARIVKLEEELKKAGKELETVTEQIGQREVPQVALGDREMVSAMVYEEVCNQRNYWQKKCKKLEKVDGEILLSLGEKLKLIRDLLESMGIST